MPNAKASYDNVPTVVFSHPTIATCGLTEAQATEQFGADNLKNLHEWLRELVVRPVFWWICRR